MVRIDGADGAPLVAIVGYTMHPTIMGPTNRLVGPDWPGHTRATVEHVLPTPADRTFTTAKLAHGSLLVVDSKFGFPPAAAVAEDRIVALK